MTTTTTPTYSAGQLVTFKGRPERVVAATPPRMDGLGQRYQQLEVTSTLGTALIGSRHSLLSAR